jgi:F0F1-type ATP synthase assembly protein I
MPNTDSHGNNGGSSYARYLYLGFTFVMLLGVFAVAGFLVDRALGSLPLLLLAGLGLGFAGGLYYVYRALEKLGSG